MACQGTIAVNLTGFGLRSPPACPFGGIGLSGDRPREGSPLQGMGVRLEMLRLTAMVRGQAME